MPCPYFFPLRMLGPGDWDPPPRMPLGAAWWGECKAGSSIIETSAGEIPETEQRELCNSGYARGRCAHFPGDAAFDAVVDAVRFAFVPEGLLYILEKDHAPVEHAVLLLDELDAETVLHQQARAFVQSHKSR